MQDRLTSPLTCALEEGTLIAEFYERLGFECKRVSGWEDGLAENACEPELMLWKPDPPDEGFFLMDRWIDADDGEPWALFIRHSNTAAWHDNALNQHGHAFLNYLFYLLMAYFHPLEVPFMEHRSKVADAPNRNHVFPPPSTENPFFSEPVLLIRSNPNERMMVGQALLGNNPEYVDRYPEWIGTYSDSEPLTDVIGWVPLPHLSHEQLDVLRHTPGGLFQDGAK